MHDDVILDPKTQFEDDENRLYENVQKGAVRIYKLGGDTNETDKDWISGSGFSIYAFSDIEGKYGVDFTGMGDEAIIQWLIDNVRTESNQSYNSIRGTKTATVYALPDDKDVLANRLTKAFFYEDGTGVSYGGAKNEYIVPELKSNSDGIVQSPRLPFGDYIIIETTVPIGRVAAAPRVLHITHDDTDDKFFGDGAGTPYGDIAIWNKDVTSYVRLIKRDATTDNNVVNTGAEYVLHDVDGAYFNWYMEDRTTAEKNNYKDQYGDLVVDLAAGGYGSYSKPLATEEHGDGTYIRTPQLLPAGTYILEEVKAPEGYVLQGNEGVYRTVDGKTIWEVENGSDGKWDSYHKDVTSDDTGIWDVNTDKASESARVVIEVNQNTAVYDSNVAAFVLDAIQENDPAVGKIAVYAEGEYLTGYSNSGSSINDRVDDSFNGYTDAVIEDGVTVEDFNNAVFDYEVRPISGSEYEIHAVGDIYSNDGTNTLLFSDGALVTKLTTDANGEAWTEEIMTNSGDTYYGLPLGTYTITQVVAGDGFALSSENAVPREFTIEYADQTIPITYKDSAYRNPRQVIDLSVGKVDIDSNEKVAGAVFGLYAGEEIEGIIEKDTLLLIAETSVDADGNVVDAVFDTAYTVDGATYESGGLPLGKYYLKELSAPKGYYSTGGVIEVDASYVPQSEVNKVRDNSFRNYKSKLLVNVLDRDTNVELDGVNLVIREGDGTVASITTVHNGTALVEGLEIGKTYTIEEVKPREGYSSKIYLNDEYESQYSLNGYKSENGILPAQDIEVTLTGDTIGTFSIADTADTNMVNVISLFNESVKADLQITKKGDVPVADLSDTGSELTNLTYEMRGLPGAEYSVYVVEDIAHPDGYSAPLYEEGYFIGTYVTDDEGIVTLNDLPLGKFRVVEDKAPKGYFLDEGKATKVVNLSKYYSDEYYAKDNYVADFEYGTEYINDRQFVDFGTDPLEGKDPIGDPNSSMKGRTGVYKIGVNGTEEGFVSGAEFKLYALEDITDVFGNIVIPKDTLVDTAISDVNGRAVFRGDLPIGTYYVLESDAPEGYYSTSTRLEVDLQYSENSDDIQIVRASVIFRNPITRTVIYLKDSITGNELAGATIRITDEDGNEFTTILTENTEGKGHVVLGLDPNKTYMIEEVMPREGYTNILRDEDGVPLNSEGDLNVTTFRFSDKAVNEDLSNIPEDNVIELYNSFVTGNLYLSKNGEVLEKIETSGSLEDKILTIFGYKETQLEGVEFTVYAATDIYHPDGVTGLLYKKGDVVDVNVSSGGQEARLLTGEDGCVSFLDMFIGQYEVKETSIPEGYAKNDVVTPFTIAYKDFVTQSVDAIEGLVEYTNIRQKIAIRVIAHDSNDESILLEGAKFGLYTMDDINDYKDELLLPADTIIETSISDVNGVSEYEADLPLGKYYLMVLEPPAGYTSTKQKIEVDATYKPDGVNVIEVDFGFYIEESRVEVSKLVSGTDSLLPGAKLELSLGNDVVESWVTKDEPKLFEGLLIGETYKVTEVSPAPGYATAAPVEFTVADRNDDGTYETQKVAMEDKPIRIQITTYELSQSGEKTPLSGVNYSILNSDGDVVTIDGSPLEFVSSADLGQLVERLPIGTYTIRVSSVPDGYVVPKDVVMDVKDTDELQEFEISVPTTMVSVKAVDATTNVDLDGVIVTIKDKDGNVVEEDVPLKYAKEKFVSGDYVITVSKVPDGYVIPNDYPFTVKDIRDEQVFVIPVDHTRVSITVVDKDTEETIEATYNVYDKDGNIVKENAPVDSLHEYFVPGEYTVEVVGVPDGYLIPDVATVISVEQVAEEQNFVVSVDYTKIAVMPVEEGTDKALPDVGLTLLDKDGVVVAEWISGDDWGFFEKLVPGTYTLSVVSVPEGWEIPDDVEIEIESISDIQEFTIELSESPEPETEAPKPAPKKGGSSSVKTGDTTPVDTWGGLGLGSLAIIAVLLLLKRKSAKSNK